MDRSERFWDRTVKNIDLEGDQDALSDLKTIKPYLQNSDTVLNFACETRSFSTISSKLPMLPYMNNFSVAELKNSIANENSQIV
jgi:hypothetical protein